MRLTRAGMVLLAVLLAGVLLAVFGSGRQPGSALRSRPWCCWSRPQLE